MMIESTTSWQITTISTSAWIANQIDNTLSTG